MGLTLGKVCVAFAAVAAVVALAAPAAGASTVTLGPPITTLSSGPECVTVGGCTAIPLFLNEATNLVRSPVDGAITKWRIAEASNVAGYAVRVLARGSGLEFTGHGTSAAVEPTGFGLEEFVVNLPICSGEYIGLNLPQGGSIGAVSGLEALAAFLPALPDNEPRTGSEGPAGYPIAFNVDIQPVPSISGIAPSAGPVSGGTAVTISGSDFTGVTAVDFGSTPATSLSVESEGRLTAVSPPGPLAAGKVHVSVTTNAGKSAQTAVDQFEYRSPAMVQAPTSALTSSSSTCLVPNLKGKRLRNAKKRIGQTDCVLGTAKVRKGVPRKSAKVVRQRPKPGTVLPAGSKIKITLG
jgi:hypothetical protein